MASRVEYYDLNRNSFPLRGRIYPEALAVSGSKMFQAIKSAGEGDIRNRLFGRRQ